MTKLKAALLIFSAFLMLAACGEKFRAKQISSKSGNNGTPTASPSQTGGTQTPTQGSTPLSVDQQFANQYQQFLSTMAVDALKNGIKAVGLTKRLASPTVDNVTLELSIATSCTEIAFIRKTVNVSQLVPGQNIPLDMGSNGFTAQLICTNTNCDEMDLAIFHRSTQSGRTSTIAILTGLKRNGNRSSTTVHQMEARLVNVNGFHAFNSITDYRAGCTTSGNTGNVLDPTGGGNSTVLDPSSGIVPTNNAIFTNNPGPTTYF